ncbi:hypothetical protein QYM36_013147, partial [Artemia franciscana]
MKLGKAVLGKKLFEKLMRATFYGQFVAGKDKAEIKPVVDTNYRFGVKSILDYSAEEDMSEEEAKAKEMARKRECKSKTPNEADLQFINNEMMQSCSVTCSFSVRLGHRDSAVFFFTDIEAELKVKIPYFWIAHDRSDAELAMKKKYDALKQQLKEKIDVGWRIDSQ